MEDELTNIGQELAVSIVVLQLPKFNRKIRNRPRDCPYCQGETFPRWGKVRKPVCANRYRSVPTCRYRCCQCRRIFRHYPQGVGCADQTQRLRKLVSLRWVLGLDGAYMQGWDKHKHAVLVAVDLGRSSRSSHLIPVFY